MEWLWMGWVIGSFLLVFILIEKGYARYIAKNIKNAKRTTMGKYQVLGMLYLPLLIIAISTVFGVTILFALNKWWFSFLMFIIAILLGFLAINFIAGSDIVEKEGKCELFALHIKITSRFLRFQVYAFIIGIVSLLV